VSFALHRKYLDVANSHLSSRQCLYRNYQGRWRKELPY